MRALHELGARSDRLICLVSKADSGPGAHQRCAIHFIFDRARLGVSCLPPSPMYKAKLYLFKKLSAQGDAAASPARVAGQFVDQRVGWHMQIAPGECHRRCLWAPPYDAASRARSSGQNPAPRATAHHLELPRTLNLFAGLPRMQMTTMRLKGYFAQHISMSSASLSFGACRGNAYIPIQTPLAPRLSHGRIHLVDGQELRDQP